MKETTQVVDNFDAAYAGKIDFLPLNESAATTSPAERTSCQAQVREMLAKEFYGAVPPPPDSISVSRKPIAGERAERVQIEIAVAEGRFTVDAALWLPPDMSSPAPLICGLDFIGPVGLMNSSGFPIDPHARVSSRPDYGARDMRIEETLRGVSAYRWPVGMLQDAGYAVLVSCYGSWVPDNAEDWKTHGLYPLLGCHEGPPIGAISLWAWAIMRLLDAAETCKEINVDRVSIAGHSRLGKAALWAAANDPRIAAVFANSSGCGGSAPAAHAVGETLAQMAERFPHWSIPRQQGSTTEQSPQRHFDQHQLLSLIAPRSVYIGGAKTDLWSDPMGSFMALQEAAVFWSPEREGDWTWPSPGEIWQNCEQVRNGPLGYHLRPGGHDLLPYDWRRFLEFLA